jgi:diguanylate cyclase (GGDEF)-like protein/PAS domain S-box-containing protein
MTFQSDNRWLREADRSLHLPENFPFRALADDVPFMVWMTDPDGSCTYLSRLWFETTGQSEPEALGLGWLDAVHVDDREGARAAFFKAGAAGAVYRCEYRLRRNDGTWAWVIDNGQPRFTPNGMFLGYVGCVLDISERKRAEEALHRSLEHYRNAVELNPHIPWTAAPDGSVIEMSPRWEALTGMTADEARGTGWTGVLHPSDVQEAKRAWSSAVRNKTLADVEYRLAMRDGAYRWFRARGAPRLDDAGRIRLWYGSVEDIHDRKLIDAALAESEERLRLAIEASELGVIDVDTASNDHRWSPRVKEMLGVQATAKPGYELYLSLVHPSDRDYAERQVAQAAHPSGEFSPVDVVRMVRPDTGETHFHERHFRQLRNEAGDVHRIVVTLRDITERQEADDRIRWIATHDGLTKLPNRELFQETLRSLLVEAAATGEQLGLVLFDVDDFKLVNDTRGHAVGDAVLRSLADQLRQCMAPGDAVARLGGDEFALVLRRITGTEDVRRRMQSLLSTLDEAILDEGFGLSCSLSGGASLYPQHGTDANDLLKHADTALYSAKAHQRSGIMIFEQEMHLQVQHRTKMLQLARTAIDQDLIVPFYQPKIDLRTGEIDGFEALLRWRDERGFIHLPGSIAAAFEDPRLASAISERMFTLVLQDIRGWLDRGVSFGQIALNASAAEFRHNDFAERLLRLLRNTDIPPTCLELEVTESVFLGRGAEYVERALQLLSKAGMGIALDDFGTGYASLTHLRQFPVSCIKIDRSFISNLQDEKEDAAIVQAVLQLGRGLGIKVVAEGIETRQQATYLAAHHCEIGQGFLLGRPMEASFVCDYIADLPDLFTSLLLPDTAMRAEAPAAGPAAGIPSQAIGSNDECGHP